MKRVLLLLGTLLLLLGVAEFVARCCLAGTTRPPVNAKERAFYAARMLEAVGAGGVRYRNRPGASVTVEGIRYRHNDLGLRDDPPRSDASFRVLVLGDSNVYGIGTAEEETFCARLERALNEPAGAPQVDVVNAGVPGYNTGDAEALFRRLADDVRPDLVLLGWHFNDLERLGFRAGGDGVLFCDPLPLPDGWKPLLWHLHLYRRVSLARLKYLREAGRYVLGQGENLAYAEERLLRLRDEVQARGVPFAVLDLPLIEPSPGTLLLQQDGYPAARYSAWLAGVAKREGIPLLPLLDAVAGDPAATYWACFQPPDHHPNGAAHARYAAAVLAFLRAEGLVPLP